VTIREYFETSFQCTHSLCYHDSIKVFVFVTATAASFEPARTLLDFHLSSFLSAGEEGTDQNADSNIAPDGLFPPSNGDYCPGSTRVVVFHQSLCCVGEMILATPYAFLLI